MSSNWAVVDSEAAGIGWSSSTLRVGVWQRPNALQRERPKRLWISSCRTVCGRSRRVCSRASIPPRWNGGVERRKQRRPVFKIFWNPAHGGGPVSWPVAGVSQQVCKLERKNRQWEQPESEASGAPKTTLAWKHFHWSATFFQNSQTPSTSNEFDQFLSLCTVCNRLSAGVGYLFSKRGHETRMLKRFFLYFWKGWRSSCEKRRFFSLFFRAVLPMDLKISLRALCAFRGHDGIKRVKRIVANDHDRGSVCRSVTNV